MSTGLGAIHSRQIEMLNNNGIRYVVRIDGAPLTTWGAVNAALGIGPHRAANDPHFTQGFMLGGHNEATRATKKSY